MKKYAILIAVEEYSAPDIDHVPYAKRDAEEFSQALALHGFDKADQLILLNSQATKGAIESQVRKVIKRLQKGDILYFYYAGHGFSKSACNFLSCHDTQNSDWDGTSVALAPLFDEMQASDCQRIVLFLDCRENGIKATPGIRSSYDNFQEQELKTFLDVAKHCMCFAACRSDESSHSSNHLHHGIWTYHVIQAFNGEAALALQKGFLTENSLQKYLAAEVPRTLRKEHATPDDQTPWMYGASSSDFILADLREILEQKREAANKGDNLVTQMSLSIEEAQGLRNLSGWRKGYRIPEQYSDNSAIFAAGLADKELRHDLDSMYAKLKETFDFTRRDLVASEPMDGTGTINTPYFNYSVTVSLNPHDLDEVTWTRTVDAIKAPAQIIAPAFAKVFDGVFDTLEFSLPARVNIEDFIDAVEAKKIPDLKIKYDRDATYCELHLRDAAGTVLLTASSLSIVHNLPQKTQQLMESFDTLRKLSMKYEVPLLSFTAPGK